MPEEEPALGHRRVAGPGSAAAKTERHLPNLSIRGADQHLEQDLEPDGAELEPFDGGLAAHEVAGERVGRLARLAEEQLGEAAAEARNDPARRAVEPAGAPAGEVARGHHQVELLGSELLKHHRQHLRRVLEVAVHDRDRQAIGELEALDRGGAEAVPALRRPVNHANDDARRRVGCQPIEDRGGLVAAVVDEDDLGRKACDSVGDPLDQGVHVAGLVPGRHHHREHSRLALITRAARSPQLGQSLVQPSGDQGAATKSGETSPFRFKTAART